jgi:glyoxylase-like metal-dependent hydrolase (beta-lactamase superfamily II)
MALPNYEVYAIRYAERDARRPANFLGGDPHDIPMPMDYFVWVARSAERTVVIDTGFTPDLAASRHRKYLRAPKDGLALLGVDASTVADVVITHLHNDHAGTCFDFPKAQFHLQDAEMAHVTGRAMGYQVLRRPYELDHVTGMVRYVYDQRVAFHDGEGEVAPGLTVHKIGGHTPGMQAVRVHTRRGWMVLASDTSHYYEHFEQDRVFTVTYNLGDVLAGYKKLRALADSPRHIVPGHDPLVLQRYPAVSGQEGIVARLDLDPH